MYPDISLSKIAEINPPRPQLSLEPETEVSFVPMGDVTDSGRWHSRQVRQFQEVKKGYTSFGNNDVLFAKITPCMENGKGCLVTGVKNGVGFGSTEFHVIRARENADPGFIYQWSIYRPFRLKAAASMTGSAGQQRVPASFLETFKIPAIEKEEQTKIADILSTVDRAIEETEALIAKQQRIKTGLMQDLLTRGIDEHGNLRSEQTHKFKDSPLGRIPVEWEVSYLSSVVKTIKRGPSLSTNNENWGIIYLTSDNISETGELIWQTIKHLDVRPDSLNSILDIGDLILNCVNSEAQIGKVGYVDRLIGVTTTGFNNFGLTFYEKKVAPKFAFYLLSHKNFQHELRKKIKPAINQSSFSSTDIADLPVVIPRMNEQQSIADKLDGVSETVQSLRKALSKVKKVKTALMQDLLTGKKRVTPLLNDTEVMSG